MKRIRLAISFFFLMGVSVIPTQASNIICMDRGLTFAEYYSEIENVFRAKITAVLQIPTNDSDSNIVNSMPYSHHSKDFQYKVVEVIKGHVKVGDIVIRRYNTYRTDWSDVIGNIDLLIGEVDEFGKFRYSEPCEIKGMSYEDLLANIQRLK